MCINGTCLALYKSMDTIYNLTYNKYNRRRIPCKKLREFNFTLVPTSRTYNTFTPGEVTEIRKRMYMSASPLDALNFIDMCFSQFGVESFCYRRGDITRTYYYINTGNTYGRTFLYCSETGTFSIGTMGDTVESLERRGFRQSL